MHAKQAAKLRCEVFEWDYGQMLGVTAVPLMHGDGGDICYAPSVGASSERSRDTDRANMELIAEAFNVFHETKMTPAELHKELVELRWMRDGLRK